MDQHVRRWLAAAGSARFVAASNARTTRAVSRRSADRLDLAGPNNTNTRLSAGYEHFLSKRTSWLANVGSAKQGALSRSTIVDLTLKHNF
jgi:hypothetical protein